ncbi:MAG: histidinol-phosphatase HisJ family protein [Lachnospirales bacterium]
MYDCHIHSEFSADSIEKLENIVLSAINKGLLGITITDHIDYDSFGNYKIIRNSLDVSNKEKINLIFNHIHKISELKYKYKDKIDIYTGFEVGASNGDLSKIVVQETLDIKELDFVILSSHKVGEEKNSALFMGCDYFVDTKYEAYKKYLLDVLKNVKLFNDFSVYGHLDYITRYCNYENKDLEVDLYIDIIDEILNVIISKGSGIEVNTSAIRYGRDDFYPQKDILKRYFNLGGEIVTVGSDSHKSEYVGAYFNQAKDYLKDCGFEYATYFENRKPKFYKL